MERTAVTEKRVGFSTISSSAQASRTCWRIGTYGWAYKSGDGELRHASRVDDTDASGLRHVAFASYRGDSRLVAADATVAD